MNRSTQQGQTTPLHEVHVAEGATLINFAGWRMPLRYNSETREHMAVRTAAGLFDLSHMGQLEVRGTDAGAALDWALVSDLGGLRIGRAKYTMMCAADGGVIDDVIVYRLDTDRYLVVANAANTDAVFTTLGQRCAGFGVMVHNYRDEVALLAVQGPHSAAILAAASSLNLDDLKYYAVSAGVVCDRSVRVARTGYTGEDGFEIFCRATEAAHLWKDLREVGAPHGLVPAGLSCRDTLRLEAGMPLYGHELTIDTNPYQAGLGRVVSFGKAADFVGRAALELAAKRLPARRLVGLALSDRRPARAGCAVLAAETGAPVGIVTSGAPSPTLGHAIAMAYVDTVSAEIGDRVAVPLRGSVEFAIVVDLPFYRRSSQPAEPIQIPGSNP